MDTISRKITDIIYVLLFCIVEDFPFLSTDLSTYMLIAHFAAIKNSIYSHIVFISAHTYRPIYFLLLKYHISRLYINK